jgi:hypothetical protein
MRVKRGTLSADKEGGRLYVRLDIEPTTDRTDELIEELKDRIHRLEYQLDQERKARTEERRRHDTLMAQLTQANTAFSERLRELEAPPERHQSSPAPSVLRDAGAEGAKEAARRLVGGIALLVISTPVWLTSVISYFNNATTATVLSALVAFFGTLTGLVATYYGVKASSDVSEEAERITREANIAVERANQEAQREGSQGHG